MCVQFVFKRQEKRVYFLFVHIKGKISACGHLNMFWFGGEGVSFLFLFKKLWWQVKLWGWKSTLTLNSYDYLERYLIALFTLRTHCSPSSLKLCSSLKAFYRILKMHLFWKSSNFHPQKLVYTVEFIFVLAECKHKQPQHLEWRF